MRIYCEIRRLEATLRISREIAGSVHDPLGVPYVLGVGNNNIYRETHAFPQEKGHFPVLVNLGPVELKLRHELKLIVRDSVAD